MLTLQPSIPNDVKIIKGICDNARLYQRSLGFEQWLDGYPLTETIEADIKSGKGHLIIYNGEIIGYCVIDLEGDSEYDRKEEIWKAKGSYAAVHRLALTATARGRRLGLPVIKTIEKYVVNHGVGIIKADTGPDNIPMQRLLASAGFTCLGRYEFSWGIRLAYEKSLYRDGSEN